MISRSTEGSLNKVKTFTLLLKPGKESGRPGIDDKKMIVGIRK